MQICDACYIKCIEKCTKKIESRREQRDCRNTYPRYNVQHSKFYFADDRNGRVSSIVVTVDGEIRSTGSIASSVKKRRVRASRNKNCLILRVAGVFAKATTRPPTSLWPERIVVSPCWLLSLSFGHDKRGIQFTSRNGLLFQFRDGKSLVFLIFNFCASPMVGNLLKRWHEGRGANWTAILWQGCRREAWALHVMEKSSRTSLELWYYNWIFMWFLTLQYV